ncbi:MAG: hypothetical protein HYV63_08425 [Candidatus Schekmanbacteria bacterium]|nr:hypothetical protein [Candidatus Schekmanbacteria bacterium]
MEQLTYLILAAVVSIVYNATIHDEPRLVAKRSAIHFAAFVVTLIAVGWLLYPLTY